MLTKGRKSWENYHHVLKSFIGWGEGKDTFCSVRSRRQHIRRHRVKRKKMAHTNLGGKKIAAQNTRSPQKKKLALSFVNIIYNLNVRDFDYGPIGFNWFKFCFYFDKWFHSDCC